MDARDMQDHVTAHLEGIVRSRIFACVYAGGPPTPQGCFELGSALLLGKSIIVAALPGCDVPEPLARAAVHVLEDFVPDDPDSVQTLARIVQQLIARDV